MWYDFRFTSGDDLCAINSAAQLMQRSGQHLTRLISSAHQAQDADAPQAEKYNDGRGGCAHVRIALQGRYKYGTWQHFEM